jgi:hypothetical protein
MLPARVWLSSALINISIFLPSTVYTTFSTTNINVYKYPNKDWEIHRYCFSYAAFLLLNATASAAQLTVSCLTKSKLQSQLSTLTSIVMNG